MKCVENHEVSGLISVQAKILLVGDFFFSLNRITQCFLLVDGSRYSTEVFHIRGKGILKHQGKGTLHATNNNKSARIISRNKHFEQKIGYKCPSIDDFHQNYVPL